MQRSPPPFSQWVPRCHCNRAFLKEQKAKLVHGEWVPWVQNNLQFDVRTAQRYRKLYENRKFIAAKNDTLPLSLTEAHKAIAKAGTRTARKKASTPPPPILPNIKKSEFKTSSSQEWGTPWDLFNNLDEEFHFTVDVCASACNTKCEKYYDIEQDGLVQDWTGEIVWCNPPFQQEAIIKWLKKAKESKCTSVFLLPARTETGWFYEYALKGEIRFIYRPIRFLLPNGEPSSGRGLFGSMIVIFRKGCSFKISLAWLAGSGQEK